MCLASLQHSCVLSKYVLSNLYVLGARNMEVSMMVFDLTIVELSAPKEEKAASFICVRPYDGSVRCFAQHMFIKLSERE